MLTATSNYTAYKERLLGFEEPTRQSLRKHLSELGKLFRIEVKENSDSIFEQDAQVVRASNLISNETSLQPEDDLAIHLTKQAAYLVSQISSVLAGKPTEEILDWENINQKEFGCPNKSLKGIRPKPKVLHYRISGVPGRFVNIIDKGTGTEIEMRIVILFE